MVQFAVVKESEVTPKRSGRAYSSKYNELLKAVEGLEPGQVIHVPVPKDAILAKFQANVGQALRGKIKDRKLRIFQTTDGNIGIKVM